jgi:hypothetical protein
VTGPLNVDPNDVNSVAVQWDALREQFNRPAPNLTGSGPESQAARAAIAEAAASTAKLQSDIGDTADTARAGAGAYTQQEGTSAGDLTGPMSDITGLFSTFGGLIEPLATEAASFGGQMLSTGSSLGTSLASLARGNTGSAPPSPGAGIGLPPADQDQQHSPDHDANTTSAAPEAAEEHHEHSVQTASEAR